MIVSAAAVFAAAVPAAAQSGACREAGLSVESRPITIDGVVGDDDTFVGVLRVTARRPKVRPVFLVAADLAPTEPQPRLPVRRSQVAIDRLKSDLPVKQPHDLLVKVAKLRFAGEYTGELMLASATACRVALKVIATASPALKLVGAGDDRKVRLRLIRCHHLQCGPKRSFRRLTPEQSRRTGVVVQVDNASQSEVRVTGLDIALAGEPGERLPAQNAFSVERSDLPFDLPGSRVSKLPEIKIDRGQLAPDHYTGAIYLTLDGGRDRAVLPLEVDVKHGPFWAIIVLLLALATYLLTGAAKRWSQYGKEINRLEQLKRQARTLELADRRIALAVIQSAEDLVYADELGKGRERRTSLEATLPLLNDVRVREAAAPKPLSPDVQTLLDEFRQAVAEARTDDAKTNYKALKEKLTAAPRRRSRTRGLQPLTDLLGRTPLPIPRAPRETTERPAPLRRRALKFAVHGLPWIVRVLGVASFVLLGLKELYFDDHTFGERMLPDYGSLFLWGIGATALDKVLALGLSPPSSAAPNPV